MKAYKHILFLLFFGLLTLQQVNAKNIGKPILQKVANLMQDGSAFRNRMTAMGKNWETVLEDILRTNSNLRCTVCNSNYLSYRSEMHQFLEEAEYFIHNFNITSNSQGKKYFNMLQGKTINGTYYQNLDLPIFDELHQAIGFLKKKGYTAANIESFGAQIGSTGKLTDITTSSGILKYIELKSLKQGSDGLDDGLNVLSGLNANPLKYRTQFVSQFIDGYLTEITNLNQLNYVFEIRKLGANGETFIKNQFKDLFIAKAEDMFNNLGRPKMEQLFLIEGIEEIENANQFKFLLNNNSAFRENALKFIKIE